jgi:glycosyltransferase involved in cell wall biosynthesis
MKRIALFIPNLSANGGAERVVVNLLQGMSERGILLDLVLCHGGGPFLNQVPKSVRIVDLETSRMAKAILPLSRYIKQYRPWAIISHLDYANLAVVIAKHLAHVESHLILVEHATISQQQSKARTFKALDRLMRLLYPRADFVVVVSKAAALDLKQHLGLKANQIKTIYNPVVSQDLFIKAREPLHHPWFDSNTFPVFLAVGRLTEIKDFPTLIKAFARLRGKVKARLLILGEGELRENLEGLATSLGISEDVSLAGFVDNPYAYMSRATALVLSSRSEALPSVLIEAMACGCPIISTDCPNGPREILAAGEYGQLVRVGDEEALSTAMLELLDKPVVSKDKLVQRALSIGSFEQATTEYLTLLDY